MQCGYCWRPGGRPGLAGLVVVASGKRRGDRHGLGRAGRLVDGHRHRHGLRRDGAGPACRTCRRKTCRGPLCLARNHRHLGDLGGDECLCVRFARGWLDDCPGNRPRVRRAGIGLRPDQNRCGPIFRTGLAMRLFQTMIFTDRPREGVRLALTTLASGAILEIYPRGISISPETMVPLVLVHVSQSDVDRARRACEAFEREMMG